VKKSKQKIQKNFFIKTLTARSNYEKSKHNLSNIQVLFLFCFVFPAETNKIEITEVTPHTQD